MKFPTYKHETQKHFEGFLNVAGCDEVGIAPLAGPVVAATVILDSTTIGKQRSKNKWWYRVRDSKTTNERERAELLPFIQDHCLDFAIGIVPRETIDEINIHQAAMLAMSRSIGGLKLAPDFLFLDGLHKIKTMSISQQPVIDGDVKILSISAASIIAKCARDEILHGLSEKYPEFGFDKNKGYPTKFHRQASEKFGVTPEHRTTFGFVQLTLKRFKSMEYFQKAFLVPSRT